MNQTGPVRLSASFREKIWGTTEIEPWFPRSQSKIGEVWFTGPDPHPILVKFLFTSEKLSVQVHPEGSEGKTEMWHILRAEPGAQIALGFREPITRERLGAASMSGEIEQLLRWIPVKAGETYFTPARTVHAIGAGIALCEIQQNSDITYRLYDYGRPRELHLDQAVQIADLGVHPGLAKPVVLTQGRTKLAHCEYFATELISMSGKRRYSTNCEGSQYLIFVEGSGRLDGREVHAGEAWLAPASPEFELESVSPIQLLRSYVPDS